MWKTQKSIFKNPSFPHKFAPGGECSIPTVCPEGFFGADCDQPCPENCFDGTCSKEIGFCASCQPGWQGVNCDTECTPGRYGKDCAKFCSLYCLSGTCDSVNGACDGGCAQGFKPPNCVEECDSGFHGFNCTEPCPLNCDQGFCLSGNGDCYSCVSGYQGNKCGDECSPKTFGVGCAESCNTECADGLCHHITGICTDCPAGKTGDYCDEDCSNGRHGNRCNKECSPHCKGEVFCDKLSGECPNGCEDGFIGQDCVDQCEPNLYGFNCTKNCSPNCVHNIAKEQTPCHHVDGACYLGCRSGYSGSACMKAIPGVTAGAIAGPIIAILLLVLAVVIGIFIWRRSKHMKGNGLLESAHRRDTSDVVGINARTNQTAKVSQTSETKTTETKSSRPSIDTSAQQAQEAYFKALAGPSKSAIKREDLQDVISSRNRNFFIGQFNSVPTSTTASKSVGMRTENRFKNRYKNISAYDHTRVHLLANSDKNQGDYINASHVKGYNEKQFIAAQGPNKIMLDDFVRMLWEQNVETVVMLTNLVEEGKPKCEMYWPEDNEAQYDEIRIRLATTQIHADYTIRTLHLMKIGHPTHTVTQFHFTSWPDKGVPKTPWSLVDFEQRVASHASDEKTVVHCSAGVGRTGTFIALHHVIREAQDKGYFDFHFVLWKLRQERMLMIQTVDQYIFLHEAARVALMCRDTTVRSSDIGHRLHMLNAPNDNGQIELEEEFKFICSVRAETTDKENNNSHANKGDVYQHGKMTCNRSKNRFNNILPKETYRPFLSSDLKEQGDYINAVFVPSFSIKNQQILTQLPLPNTIVDFWQMVTLYNVSLIVALDLEDSGGDETIGQYLPVPGTVSSQHGPFLVETGPRTVGDDWEMRKLSVQATKKKKTRRSLTAPKNNEYHISHLKCLTKSFTTDSLISFLQKVKELTPPGQGRTVYMCRNGANHSGLVCVLSLLLDRMDNDHHVTVPLVVGAIKSIRPQVIPTLDQYRMLYESLKLYYLSNNIYFNYGYAQEDNTVVASSGGLSRDNASTVDIRASQRKHSGVPDTSDRTVEGASFKRSDERSNVYFKLCSTSTHEEEEEDNDNERGTVKSDSFEVKQFPNNGDSDNNNVFTKEERRDDGHNVYSNQCFQGESEENNDDIINKYLQRQRAQPDLSNINQGSIYTSGGVYISNL